MDLLNSDLKVLEAYSRDASLFKVMPKFVAIPKNVEELKQLVKFARENKESLTMRAGGSDMTGGPLSKSIIVDIKNFNKIGEIKAGGTSVGPGVFYRDFEPKTLAQGLILPCYPASKDIAAIGGMAGNNCGGEKSLRYGKMENFVVESKWIFADGNEYVIKPVSKAAFDTGYEQEIFELIEQNKEIIEKARPKVSKNSAGYYLWNVWDGKTFDLNKLLVGSQGTLGIMTEATVRLVPAKKHHDMVALFFKSWDDMPGVVNTILPYEPESLETFDKDTIKMGMKFMPFYFATRFLPETLIGIKMLGLPELVVLAEIAEETEVEVKRKIAGITEALKPFKIQSRVVDKDSEEEKFWKVRRESFNLLRKHSGNKRTAPFVEDFSIRPELIPEFLPKAKKILEDAGIEVNIAGHAGNGNFHIIPLMDLKLASERHKLLPVADKFYSLVAEYKGSITGEHNDGIIRTPYLSKMYSPEMLELFKKVKQIFDPENIFNPGKKVGGTLEDIKNHLALD